MTQNHESSPWIDPAWLNEVCDWIHVETNRSGHLVTGSLKQIHERPWSAVFQVPAAGGKLIFKASADVLSHEAGLTQALANLRPDDLPRVLAADPERGRMLMVDGGTRLREILRADSDVGHWERLLPQYAHLQMAITDHLDEVKALGVPDRSTARLPLLYQSLLMDEECLLLGMPAGITIAEHDRLLELIPRVASICEQLRATPIPDSIHHGDLHDGNIFLTEQGYLFFDWGDASISHPFFSLRTAWVSLENSLGWEQDSPAFNPLRDVYLDAWGEFGSTAELLAAFKLARVLSPICSALSWHRVVSSLDKFLRVQYEEAIPSLLREYLAEEARVTE